jgi:hypothetical protein
VQKKPEWNNPEEDRDFFWRLPQFVAQIRLNLDLDHYSSQLQILA